MATPATAQQHLDQLVALVINCVDDGASIGWLPPMQRSDAQAYWEGRVDALHTGTLIMLLALEEDRIAGTVQLALEQRPNGVHRAEVQKLMVHTTYRRRGIARQLMQRIEQLAVENQRRMLFLDTRRGDASEILYRQLGYVETGIIPQYVISPGGVFDDTVFYAKILDA